MKRFRRVLYATNFSPASRPAFAAAPAFAKANHARPRPHIHAAGLERRIHPSAGDAAELETLPLPKRPSAPWDPALTTGELTVRGHARLCGIE